MKRLRDSMHDDGEGFATASEHGIENKKKKKKNKKRGGQITGVSMSDHENAQDEGEGFEPSINKKKKEKRVEQLTSVSLLDHGSVQNEGEGFGPGFEQKKNKEVKGRDLDHGSMQDEGEGLELSIKKKRKKEKTVEHSKEEEKAVVEHSEKEKRGHQVTRFHDSMQDGEDHDTSDKKKQKIKSKMEKHEKIVNFSLLHHDSGMPDEEENHGRGQKKKKKKKDQVEQEALLFDFGKVSMHDIEEDDMLFNFSVQPEVVVDNRASHRSRKEEVSQHLNGSSQQDEKMQNESLTQQKHLKKDEKKEKRQAEQKVEEAVKESSNLTKSPEYISRPTVSLAIAGSIADNAQSLELATMLAGQIARAAAIFRIDEIVVFDDYDGAGTQNNQAKMQDDNGEETGGLFMVRILEYLEVPQYLRRALIPMHRSLSSVGKLPPLDAPHHLRRHERRSFREGVVLDKRPSSGSAYVDIGLDKEVLIDQSLKPGTRVTVAMGQTKTDGDVLQVVDREAARQAGIYWGYRVRYASCLSAVFEECPFEVKTLTEPCG